MEVGSAQLFGLPSLPANHQISGKLPLSSPHPQLIPCLGPLKLLWVSWGRGSFVAWRQCQFAWNGFSLTFSNEPHCASLCFRHLPSGLLTLHFLVPSPAPQAAHSLQSLVMSAPEPWPWGEVGVRWVEWQGRVKEPESTCSRGWKEQLSAGVCGRKPVALMVG